jgi:VCBS repeat-containing protein
LDDGGYVVAWQSYLQDGELWGIYTQQYASDGTTAAVFLESDGLETIHTGTLSLTTDLDTTDTHTFQIDPASVSVAVSSTAVVVGLAVAITDATAGTYNVVGNFDALAAGDTATITFEYTATDDSGEVNAQSVAKVVSMVVTGTNDAPVAVGDTDAVSEDGTLVASGMVSATDLDTNDTHTFAIQGTGVGAYGSVVITDATTGAWEYTLDNANSAVQDLDTDDLMSDTFIFVADDGNGGTDTATISVDVAGADEVEAMTITFGDFAGLHSGYASAEGGDGDDTLAFGAGAGYDYGHAIAVGGAGDDTITFTNGAGLQNGTATAEGGEGDDTITFGANAGNRGYAIAEGGAGDDTITFGAGAGRTHGPSTPGGVYGSAIAEGGDGDDTITFGDNVGIEGGAAIAAGGAGADTFEFGTNVNNLTIDLGADDQDQDSVTFQGTVFSSSINNWEVGLDLVSVQGNWTGHDDGTDTTFTSGNQEITFLGVTDVAFDEFFL